MFICTVSQSLEFIICLVRTRNALCSRCLMQDNCLLDFDIVFSYHINLYFSVLCNILFLVVRPSIRLFIVQPSVTRSVAVEYFWSRTKTFLHYLVWLINLLPSTS